MNYYFEVIRKYAVFSGRARRKEYWFFVLFNTIISIILTIFDKNIGVDLLDSIYSLVVFLPSLAVGVRRMHDTNHSGWFLIIPIYNIILLCTEGDYGNNDYGIDPIRNENNNNLKNDE